MEIAGTFNPIPAAKARDNLGVTAELAKKLSLDGAARMTGKLRLQDTTGSIATSGGDLGSTEVRSAGASDAAFISFHRPGAFAAYLGMDTDNKFKVGGWSMGGNAYELWHAGNFNPTSLSPTTVTFGAGQVAMRSVYDADSKFGRIDISRPNASNGSFADIYMTKRAGDAGVKGATSHMLRLDQYVDGKSDAYQWPFLVKLDVAGSGGR